MRDHRIGFLHLTLVKCSGLWIIAPGNLGSFGKGPRQVFVAAFLVSFAFFLVVADPFGRNLPAVGAVVADLHKTADRTGLKHDGKSQRLTHALHREELFIPERDVVVEIAWRHLAPGFPGTNRNPSSLTVKI